MIFRHEKENEYFQVENLIRESFWNKYQPGCSEHLLMKKLRQTDIYIPELSYIIEKDKQIIGQVAYSKGYVELPNKEKKEVLTFGPVCILPEYQKKGYGKALLSFTLDKAKELGYSCVIIEGNIHFYSKVGFEDASKYGITYGCDGPDNTPEYPFFLIKVFDLEKVKELKGGVYKDQEVFYNLPNDELEEFEKQFPFKKKEVLPTQIFNPSKDK